MKRKFGPGEDNAPAVPAGTRTPRPVDHESGALTTELFPFPSLVIEESLGFLRHDISSLASSTTRISFAGKFRSVQQSFVIIIVIAVLFIYLYDLGCYTVFLSTMPLFFSLPFLNIFLYIFLKSFFKCVFAFLFFAFFSLTVLNFAERHCGPHSPYAMGRFRPRRFL